MGLRLDIWITDLVDVAVVTIFLYATILWLRRTRAAFVALGILILGSLYLAARALELQLTTWIFQGFFAVFLVMIVVIFQAELRQVFERIALWSLRRKPGPAHEDEAVDRVVGAVAKLARSRTGALIVFPGTDPIDRHVNGGIALSGRVTEPLLLSIFDESSPGHDGAVIIRGNQIDRFAAHLPLSTDFAQLGNRGTRHAAALGLTEHTDALCVVLSEERGEISVARDGVITLVETPQEAAAAIGTFLRETGPRRTTSKRPFATLLVRNWREKIGAVSLSGLLWVVLVPGSQVSSVTIDVPVAVDNLPPSLPLERIEPETVSVRLSGPRRTFYWFDPSTVTVTIDGTLAQLGRRTFQILDHAVSIPDDLILDDVEPRTVRISIETPKIEPSG